MPERPIEPPSDSRPVHLLDEPDDARTRCGLRAAGRDAACPRMLARFVAAHVEGRARAGRAPLELCGDCETGR